MITNNVKVLIPTKVRIINLHAPKAPCTLTCRTLALYILVGNYLLCLKRVANILNDNCEPQAHPIVLRPVLLNLN